MDLPIVQGIIHRLRLLTGSEARFHPAQEPPEWATALSGPETDAGVTMTPDTAISLTAVFACVRILAETLAMLPLQVFKKQGQGRTPAGDFYLDRILSEEPNPEMTSFEFRETLMGHLATWGNSFAEIDWDGAGRVRGLWPLPPNKVSLRREKGQLIYSIRLPRPDAQGRMSQDLPAYRVWHLRGLGSSGLVGYSPISLFRQSLGLTKAAEEFGARFFGNGARPGFVLTHPGKLDKDVHSRLKKSWEEAHQGLSNSHRVAIIEEGMTVEKVGVPPEDAQFLATRKFQTSEIARIYRMQPHKIGDLEHATFSNIEHMAIEFVVDTMLPWLVRWETSAKRALMLPSERQAGYYLKFNAEGLLRGDTISRYQSYAVARQWGWLSANDVRQLEDLNPIEGGDVYMMPLNMVPVGQIQPEQEVNRAEQRTSPAGLHRHAKEAGRIRHRLMARFQGLFAETLTRVMRRERNDVLAQARKSLRQRSLSDLQNWLEDFYREHENFAFEQLLPLFASYGESVRDAVSDELGGTGDPDFERFLRAYAGSFSRRYGRKQLLDLLGFLERTMADRPFNEIFEALEAELDSWLENRPAETAHTEAVRANNAIAKQLYVLAGITTLRWVNLGDSCPYCTNLDGMETQVNAWFLEPGEFAPEGAEKPLTITSNIGHPPAHRGCDCMIVAGGRV